MWESIIEFLEHWPVYHALIGVLYNLFGTAILCIVPGLLFGLNYVTLESDIVSGILSGLTGILTILNSVRISHFLAVDTIYMKPFSSLFSYISLGWDFFFIFPMGLATIVVPGFIATLFHEKVGAFFFSSAGALYFTVFFGSVIYGFVTY